MRPSSRRMAWCGRIVASAASNTLALLLRMLVLGSPFVSYGRVGRAWPPLPGRRLVPPLRARAGWRSAALKHYYDCVRDFADLRDVATHEQDDVEALVTRAGRC